MFEHHFFLEHKIKKTNWTKLTTNHLSLWVRQSRLIILFELRGFKRFSKMRLAALIVACIPSVYALIYLSSIWDPRSQSVALPVGLVNLDDGVNYRDSTFNIGFNLVDGGIIYGMIDISIIDIIVCIIIMIDMMV